MAKVDFRWYFIIVSTFDSFVNKILPVTPSKPGVLPGNYSTYISRFFQNQTNYKQQRRLELVEKKLDKLRTCDNEDFNR